MYHTKNQKEKIFLFFKIFLPVLIYQLANYSAAFIDTTMTGQYGTLDLAGVSTATSLWQPFFTFLTGIVSALIPIVAHHLGKGEKEKIRQDFHQFIYMSLLLSVVLLLIVLVGAMPVLARLGLESQVLSIGRDYLSWLILGIPPLFIFSVCRAFFDALGLTRLSMYLMLLLVPFNSFFNYLLIYGKLGLPQMGGAGAGLGTALAYWLLLIVVLIVMTYHLKIKPYNIWQWQALNIKQLKSGFQLGLPIGAAIFAEVAIFAVVGLFMAKYSSQMIAAHQAAMNFSSLMYAFPLSISTALSITVAYEVGAKRYQDAATYGRLGRISVLLFTFGTLCFLYLFRTNVARLYGSDDNFVQTTSIFLTYSLCFQLADAFTAPVQGILRGYKDTTLPFIIGVVAYWGVSLPIALILEAYTRLGPYSYWIGLIIGIACCGICLNLRLITIQKRIS